VNLKKSNRRAALLMIPLLAMALVARPALAAVRVVTTTTTLGDITHQIGGDLVHVTSLMKGPENVHNIKPKPSFIMRLKKADLFVHSGLDAEPWLGQLIHTSRQKRFLPGQPGSVDVSGGITLLEVPQRGQLSRAMGDIHVFGNTHYDKDPLNGIIIAGTIADALKNADPAHAEQFDANLAAFTKKIRDLTERLVAQMKPYRGQRVVVYHRAWPYFLNRFGLVRGGEIEPKPGIAPGPRHLAELADTMRTEGIKIVIVETYNNRKIAESVAQRAGAQAVLLAPAVNALPEADTYEHMFEHDISAIVEAFQRAGIAANAGDS